MFVRSRSIVLSFGLLFLTIGVARAGSDVHYYEGLFDLSIPAAPGQTKGWMTDAVLDVPDHIIVGDLDVSLTVTHSNVFDLQIFLQSPSGTQVLLNMYDPSTGYFHGADYEGTIFDDEAGVSIQSGHAPFTGRFQPMTAGTLSAFDGQDAYGPWRLRIYDAYYSDTGELQTFGLFITAPVPSAAGLALIGLAFLRRCVRRVPMPAHRVCSLCGDPDTHKAGPGRRGGQTPGS
jgi:hypothetical protein